MLRNQRYNCQDYLETNSHVKLPDCPYTSGSSNTVTIILKPYLTRDKNTIEIAIAHNTTTN